jgi:DNA topoisomerase-3
MVSQDFGPQYGWSTCPPVTLFETPIETLYRPDMVPLERMLQTLSRQAQVLILWLDCDREGDAISDEV